MSRTAVRPRRSFAQDVVNLTWFAARDQTGFSPTQVEAFNAAAAPAMNSRAIRVDLASDPM